MVAVWGMKILITRTRPGCWYEKLRLYILEASRSTLFANWEIADLKWAGKTIPSEDAIPFESAETSLLFEATMDSLKKIGDYLSQLKPYTFSKPPRKVRLRRRILGT